MPDIEQLLFKLIETKGLMHVASALGHESTKILERWKKDQRVPEGKKFKVLQVLKDEGVA